jgi:predicted metalloprotease with PDZ domain
MFKIGAGIQCVNTARATGILMGRSGDSHPTPRMPRLATLPMLLAFALAPLGAQQPYGHFTEAVEIRYARSQPIVTYRLHVDSADLSGFAVEMRIRNAPDTVRLAMAAHPEYDDRYWRHLRDLRVETRTGVVPTVREDSASWRVVAPRGSELLVRYRIALPAPQESPRAAWRPVLAPTGGLLGGPHSFLYLLGHTLVPSHVVLDLPASWRVATGLEPTADPRTWFAPTVDALVDSPIMAGRFHDWRFAIDAVPHRVVYWPASNAPAFDTIAFVRGLEGIARGAVGLFGRPPYREYTFVFQDDAYGGLEHRNSLTLGAPAAALSRDMHDVFAETAHEFTHTWNLMRIRPEEYGDVSHRTQRPVSGLWFSEGLTMYYADVFLRRAGLPASDSTRIAHLQGLLARYLASAAYARFSAEQVSRVAYNAEPGALGDYSPSVHLMGEVLGTVLDLVIRDATAGRRSMDDVMRLMLERHSGPRGFASRDVERAAADVCGCDVRELFARHVLGAAPLDVGRWFGLAGLRVDTTWAPAMDREGRPVMDLRARAYQPAEGGAMRMIVTDPASVWGRAGLHTNDQLVSINGRPVRTWSEVRPLLVGARIGDTLRFEIARPSGPFRTNVVMAGLQRPIVRITPRPDATARQRAVLAGWLARASPDGR